MNELIPILLISLLLLESILLISWNRIYFRFGIPIYVKRIPFYGSLNEPFDAEFLEKKFQGVYMPNMFFRKISSKECVFREKLWNFRISSYIPVMRGLIKGDEENNSLCIIGYINWYVVFFAIFALFSAILSSSPSWTPLLALAILFYFIQANRFKNIADAAFEWLKKND